MVGRKDAKLMTTDIGKRDRDRGGDGSGRRREGEREMH